ncbi:hypothetical protein EZV62_005105 [Acer yangbiense]|uniref:Uncharacterized protein n=1 Tax=Acer yangbiense TaxID=1000413 RepID=A0A5C7ILY8_9ROSI|nr:hypothetical protein EZV62_005105 [Acer yangbiense]
MGQALKKFGSGSEVKAKEIDAIIQKCYEKHCGGKNTNELNLTHLYRATSESVEEINKKFGHTQIRLPDIGTLKEAYDKHHGADKNEALTREEFQEILEDVIKENAGLTGFGAKEIVLYMFGIPAAALFIKQRVAPKALPNDVFIPLVTSATVYLLAKLNKL